MRQYSRIITNKVLRNEEIERTIIEHNRERVVLILMLVGAILVLYAITQ